MDSKSTFSIIAFAHKEEADESIVFQTYLRSKIAGPFMLVKTAGNLIENDSNINIAVGGELVTCGRAVQVNSSKTFSV